VTRQIFRHVQEDDDKLRAVLKQGKGQDPINHPAHYNQGKIEVIDAIEDWKLGFHEGNVVKYIARSASAENMLQDLKKARWYIDRLIKNLEGK